MARRDGASVMLTSPWIWPPLGIVALSVAGWKSGPVAVVAVAVGLLLLATGFGLGVFIAGRRTASPAVASRLDGRPSEAEPEGRPALLRGANLRNADLRGANLSGADLEGADLRGANLAPLTGEQV